MRSIYTQDLRTQAACGMQKQTVTIHVIYFWGKMTSLTNGDSKTDYQQVIRQYLYQAIKKRNAIKSSLRDLSSVCAY